MNTTIEKLDSSGYRRFGLLTAAILAALFGFLLPWLLSQTYPLWPWVISGALVGLALITPTALRPIYYAWMKFGNLMNWINMRLILGVLFFGIFLPFGIVMRLIGKDPMRRKIDKNLNSYRIISHNEPKNNVERPY